ncbi:MAG: ParB/RepB/Spo0J family partition protein [Rikenellaceae bacterium]|jgi:ParB family chromosome partitioning protein|nr:ParB/RepB/Spo0J family partition protein [Rikenellaceae bacterium]
MSTQTIPAGTQRKARGATAAKTAKPTRPANGKGVGKVRGEQPATETAAIVAETAVAGQQADAVSANAEQVKEQPTAAAIHDQLHAAAVALLTAQPADQVMYLPLHLLESNPFNPRKSFDREQIRELAGSVATHGIIQPITVRPVGDGRYQIVCGERRYAAAMVCEMDSVPCIVRDDTEEQAQEASIVENIQRADVTPVEEAAAFRQLMTVRGYTIAELCHRFGKSDKYIRSRLQLCNLIDEIAQLLDENQINLSVALELARHSADIQREAYTEHFTPDCYPNWTKLSATELRRRMDDAYSMSLGNYPFDKAECNTCPHNTATHDLFAASEGACGNCQNMQCLQSRCTAHMKAAVTAIAKANPQANFFTQNLSSLDSSLKEHVEAMGFDVHESYYADTYPVMPDEPRREEFDSDEDHEQALADYPDAVDEYRRELSEVEQAIADGKAVRMYCLDDLEPELCYKRVAANGSRAGETVGAAGGASGSHAGTGSGAGSGSGAGIAGKYSGHGAVDNGAIATSPEEAIAELEAKDKRYNEIRIEKSVEDVKKLIREQATPQTAFAGDEEQMMYFLMLSTLRSNNYKLLGVDERWYLTEEQKAQAVASLTEDQKTLIRRDFLIHHLTEAAGVNRKSEYLLAFAALHFPSETAALRQPHDAKRHTSLVQRIGAIRAVAGLPEAGSEAGQEAEAVSRARDGEEAQALLNDNTAQTVGTEVVAASDEGEAVSTKAAVATTGTKAAIASDAEPLPKPDDPSTAIPAPDEKPDPIRINIPDGTPVHIEIEEPGEEPAGEESEPVELSALQSEAAGEKSFVESPVASASEAIRGTITVDAKSKPTPRARTSGDHNRREQDSAEAA